MFWFRRAREPFIERYQRAPLPTGKSAWQAARYVVLDIETSGLNARRDQVLAIGLVEVLHGRVQLASAWQRQIRPPEGFVIDPASIRIHQILNADLHHAPPRAEVLRALLERLEGAILVVHVAAIDVDFLDRALREEFGCRLRRPIIDTAHLAMRLHQEQHMLNGTYGAMPPPAIALRTLADACNLPTYAQHNALNDAITTAQLFLAQATRIARRGRATLGELLRAGRV